MMCPYTNKHKGNSTKIRKDVLENLEEWEKEELNIQNFYTFN